MGLGTRIRIVSDRFRSLYSHPDPQKPDCADVYRTKTNRNQTAGPIDRSSLEEIARKTRAEQKIHLYLYQFIRHMRDVGAPYLKAKK